MHEAKLCIELLKVYPLHLRAKMSIQRIINLLIPLLPLIRLVEKWSALKLLLTKPALRPREIVKVKSYTPKPQGITQSSPRLSEMPSYFSEDARVEGYEHNQLWKTLFSRRWAIINSH